jgi:hypothetical protein
MRSLDAARGWLGWLGSLGGPSTSRLAALLAGSLALVGAQPSCSTISGLYDYRVDQTGEGCTDGVDDDGDALVDCADPECGAFSCAPRESGWEGPFLVYEAPYAAASPGCADGSTPELFVSGARPEAACSACVCGEPTGVCLVPSLECGAAADCSAPATVEPMLDVCVDATLPGGGCTHAPFEPDQASLACGTTGGEVVGQAFEVRVALCSTRGEGCEGGGACLPVDPSARRCVRAAGDLVCPSGYVDKRLVHSAGTDTRSCSPCSCALESSPSCEGGRFSLFAPGCAGASIATTPEGGACAALPGVAAGDYGVEVIPAALTGGTCGTPSVSIPSGEITVPDTSTLCCELP